MLARERIEKQDLSLVEPLNCHVPLVSTFVLTLIESLFEASAVSVGVD